MQNTFMTPYKVSILAFLNEQKAYESRRHFPWQVQNQR